MKTQYDEARTGNVTGAIKEAAVSEHTDPECVMADIAAGTAVLTLNPAHKNCRPTVVGRKYRTKVNANIGRSVGTSDLCGEMDKLQCVIDAGADFVMDLSVGEDSDAIRQEMLSRSPLPLGTVPIYEAYWRADSDINNLTDRSLIEAVAHQAAQGVDFMTIHAGLLREHLEMSAARKMGIVSRGGSLIAEWMAKNGCENPFFSNWDEILQICHDNDVTLSLGDGLRPGCIADASDEAQFAELDTLGELVLRCREAGVQVMVEGPGHVPFHEIQMNVERQIERCHGAPFYVLGPIVTDIAAGYDHIASAIGGTAAAFHGAALLCYVTPAEHLGLPTLDDVREGIMSHRMAAHAADVAKGLEWVKERDNRMADARAEFDWKKQFSLALDGERAREKYEAMKTDSDEDDHCSMCGKEFCAIRTTRRFRDQLSKNPEMPEKRKDAGIHKLLDTVATLRAENGCPWDRKQTLETLKQYLIEESYEVIDAIDSGSVDLHCEELGDVLLQVALQAEIRREKGEFDFDDVADRLAEKLIRRHPHVFGSAEADTPEEVLKNWEEIKAEERADTKKTIFDSIARHLPALQKAQRIQSKASRVGFDWSEITDVIDKIEEELEEMKAAIQSGEKAHIEEEVGDVLFSVANLCRFVDIVGEHALESCNRKFMRRFGAMEKRIQAEGKDLSACTLEEMEEHWVAAKQAERE